MMAQVVLGLMATLSPVQLLKEVELGRGQTVLPDLLAQMRQPGAEAVLVQAAAQVERQAGRLSSALRILDEGLSLHAGSTALRRDRALFLAFDGRYAESLSELEMLMQEAPTRETALLQARVLLWAGESQKSRAAFRRLTDAHDADVSGWVGRADAALALGDFGEARRFFLQVASLPGGQAAAQEGLDRLRRIPRVRLEARLGAIWTSGEFAPALQAYAQYAFSGQHSIAVEYQFDALGLGDLNANRLVHSGQAQWGWRPRRGLAVSSGVRLVYAKEASVVQWPQEVSVTVTKGLNLVTLLRPGIRLSDATLQVLAAVGLQMELGQGRWLMLQCFASRDAQRGYAIVAVGSAELQPVVRLGLRVAMSGGVTDAGAAFGANFEVSWQLTEQWHVFLAEQSTAVVGVSHRAALGLRAVL